MRLRSCIILAAALVLVGCVTDPEIQVRTLEKVSAGPAADEYALHVDLRNPTDAPMVLDRWQYTVSTNVGRWESEWVASQTLPPRSLTEQVLPVVMRHAEGPSEVTTVTTWHVTGNLRFLLPGQLAETLFDLGVSRPDADFSGAGLSTSLGAEAPAVNSGTRTP